jgi:hypothetical protein
LSPVTAPFASEIVSISVTDRMIDNHGLSLRKRIEHDPTTTRHLIGVRGWATASVVEAEIVGNT